MASFSILTGELAPGKGTSDNDAPMLPLAREPSHGSLDPDAQLAPVSLLVEGTCMPGSCPVGRRLQAPGTHGRQGRNARHSHPVPSHTLSCSASGRAAPTERGREETVHDDVCVAADGRGEVRVEGHVQGVVAKEGLVLQDTSAEVESHLKGARSEGRV